MSLTEITIEGTIKPDGTLELDQKPGLPPGRVTILLRQETDPSPSKENWWQFMQRTRRELEAAGSQFMNAEEVQAYIESLRESDQIDEMLRQVGEQLRPKEQS